MELLTYLGTTPCCSVTIAEALGFDGSRFQDAVHDLRESGLSLVTSDRETICVSPVSWHEANKRATAYATRHHLN